MNTKYIKFFGTILLLLFTFSFFSPNESLAIDKFNESLKETSVQSGHSTGGNPAREKDRLYVMISEVVRVALSLLGIIFLLIIIYAGFIWMMARGNEQEVERAKKFIQNSIIGLIIVLSAYAITSFVGESLTAEPIVEDETT